MSKVADLWHCVAQLGSAEWPELPVTMCGLELTNCGSCESTSACRSAKSACTAGREVVPQAKEIAPLVTLGPKLADLRMRVAYAPVNCSSQASCWTDHSADSDRQADLQCLLLMARPAGQAVLPGHCPSRLRRSRWHSSACMRQIWISDSA